MVESLVCFKAVFRFQLKWCGVSTEHRSPSRRSADRRSVRMELDIQRAGAPHLLKEWSVFRNGKFIGYARSVRVAHFLCIDRRTLCLVGVGIPEQIAGRA